MIKEFLFLCKYMILYKYFSFYRDQVSFLTDSTDLHSSAFVRM